jgi:DNA-binding PadR family transcriptional regulator
MFAYACIGSVATTWRRMRLPRQPFIAGCRTHTGTRRIYSIGPAGLAQLRDHLKRLCGRALV